MVVRRGKILLATRKPGAHLAGAWEFPGGKCREGETLADCIARELEEELSLPIRQASLLFSLTHQYPEKCVELHFMHCTCDDSAEAIPREGQQCGWFAPDDWHTLEFAPADAEMLAEHDAQLRQLCAESSASSPRLPAWLRTAFSGGEEGIQMRRMLRSGALHTVCEGAKCPNRCECWRNRTATFMILGDTCTRACRFCSVKHGRPAPPDPDEPAHIAQCVEELGLKYAVVTCVTRDDLPDGGASAMAATIAAIRTRCPDTKVEVLVSDYQGDHNAIDTVLAARPAVFGHNLETVARLSTQVRSGASYARSLEVLKYAAQHCRAGTLIKSGMMLGLGESDDEVRQALQALKASGVSIVTLGQYLRPTRQQLPVVRFIPPSEFAAWARYAEDELGFRKTVCGPLVRSSYKAAEAAL